MLLHKMTTNHGDVSKINSFHEDDDVSAIPDFFAEVTDRLPGSGGLSVVFGMQQVIIDLKALG